MDSLQNGELQMATAAAAASTGHWRPDTADLKRNQAGVEHEPPTKRQYTGAGQRAELRFLIPSKMAGVIIGKGGANIKRLREEFSAKVSVPDSNGPERVLALEGELPRLEALLADLFRTLHEDSGRDSQGAVSPGGDIDLRLLVHQSQAGCLIGKGGSKIKELREDSRLRSLKVYSVMCPGSSDRVVQMVGGGDDLLKSIRTITELLDAAPPKGQIANYDARNFDEFNSEQYGGWLGTGSGARATYGGAARQDPQGPLSLGGAPPPPPPPTAAFAPGPPLRPPPRAAPVGAAAPFGAAALPRPAAETTQQVSIPDTLTGSIMGRGGQRIKQIRAESGADIKIDRGEPGQDRIITIRGSPEQIQNAQYLMQMCVKKYSGQY